MGNKAPLSHSLVEAKTLYIRALVEIQWVIIVTVCPSQTQCQGYQQARGNRKQVCVQALWPKKKSTVVKTHLSRLKISPTLSVLCMT